MPTYIAFLRAINIGKRKFAKDGDRRGVRGGRLHRRRDLHQHRQRPGHDAAAEPGEGRGGAREGVRGRGRLRGADDRADAEGAARGRGRRRRAGRGHDGRHYVSLLKDAPSAAAVKKLDGAGKDGERAVVRGRGAHLLLGQDYHSATLSNAIVEKHLGVATNRNLNVIRTLAEKWGWLSARRGSGEGDAGRLHLGQRLLGRSPERLPAQRAPSTRVSKPSLAGVERGGAHAVVGGDAADVDLVDLLGAQPVHQRVRRPRSVPSNAEYAASWSPLRKIASNGCGSRFGWNASPSVPTSQWTGQESTKSGSLGPVVTGVDVVVLARHHDVVRRSLVVAARPVVQQLPDVAGHPGPALDRQRAALAEVVLDVHDDQRAGHVPRLSTARARSVTGQVNAPGQPGDDVGDHGVPQAPLVVTGAEVGGEVDPGGGGGSDEALVGLEKSVGGAAPDVERRDGRVEARSAKRSSESRIVSSKARWKRAAVPRVRSGSGCRARRTRRRRRRTGRGR